MKFKDSDVGKKVVLPENRDEGWKEEIGELLAVDGEMIIVSLDAQYIDKSGDVYDDGIRECSSDGVFFLSEREDLEKQVDQMTSLHTEWPK